MRKKLQRIEGQRLRFRATVERFGEKRGWRDCLEATLLLTNICRVDNGKNIADHLWFTVGSRFDDLNLNEGETIEFDARVSAYVKGNANDREPDCKLSYPTRVNKVSSSTEQQPLDVAGSKPVLAHDFPQEPPQEPPKHFPQEPSSFAYGDLAILTHPRHPYEGQVCTILKAINNKFIMVVFEDKHQVITSDRRLLKQESGINIEV